MPIYEYQCQSCDHHLEKLQRMSDPVLTDCPECDKPELKKLISAAGFRLSGSGWYETDFKGNDSKGNDSKGNESKGKDSIAKDSTSSDAGNSKANTAADTSAKADQSAGGTSSASKKAD